MPDDSPTTGFRPPADDADRTRDFLERHGGPGTEPPRHAQSNGGLDGWVETEAADGWILRCDWSRLAVVEEIRYTEVRSPKPG